MGELGLSASRKLVNVTNNARQAKNLAGSMRQVKWAGMIGIHRVSR